VKEKNVVRARMAAGGTGTTRTRAVVIRGDGTIVERLTDKPKEITKDGISENELILESNFPESSNFYESLPEAASDTTEHVEDRDVVDRAHADLWDIPEKMIVENARQRKDNGPSDDAHSALDLSCKVQ
jgi:hypothetical protein